MPDAPSSAEKSIVFAITNRKGGTGKTTTALNLAAEIAAEGYATLLIDLDTQGHCAVGLGMTITADQPTIHSLFMGSSVRRNPLSSLILTTAISKLDLIAADQRFEHGDAARDPLILKRSLTDGDLCGRYGRYRYVILDTPPSLDMLLINALAAADGVIIPFIPHHLAAEGVEQLARLFYKVAMMTHSDLNVRGLLPIMFDPRINHHRAVVDGLGKKFGREKVLRGIRNDIRVAEAFAAGKPVRHFCPKSRGALDFYLLAEHLLNSQSPPTTNSLS